MSVLLALALAGCAAPTQEPGDDAPGATTPAATTVATTAAGDACEGGDVAGSSSYQFVRAYVTQENPYDGGAVGAFLAKEHLFRSWTDLRIVAFRNASSTGEPGTEIATVDATNGSTTWRLQLDYAMPSRCVEDRAADDERMCAHWTGAADAFVAAFNAVGGWSALGSTQCDPSGRE